MPTLADLTHPGAELSRDIAEVAHPLTGAAADYDELLELIGDAHYVLIGEASHGTREFYRERAEITKRLIEEKAFTAVAVEADWPDAYRINCYVKGRGQDAGANDALGSFKRFPTWMWRNTEVLHFVGWLRGYNAEMPGDAVNVGFYGIDLYSMYASIDAVLHYLEHIDPEAAQRARHRYSCFDHFHEDSQAYGYSTTLGLAKSCETEVLQQLMEMQTHAISYASRNGGVAEDEYFFAEQNARLVRNAERYYRAMFQGRDESWNLRDRHMAEALAELVKHLNRNGGDSKVVVWAHNSHLGDARATEMSSRGELNVGQLVRERYAGDSYSIGFSTYHGQVTAAHNWDEIPHRMRVRAALSGSYERIFHEAAAGDFWLNLRDRSAATQALQEPRLERAIGVIYRPESERVSHYFYSVLPRQFDALLHIDTTHALEPLERNVRWDEGEVPETYPSGV